MKSYHGIVEEELKELKEVYKEGKSMLDKVIKSMKEKEKTYLASKAAFEKAKTACEKFLDNDEVILYEKYLTKSNPGFEYSLVDAAFRSYEYSNLAYNLLKESKIVAQYDESKTLLAVAENKMKSDEIVYQASISEKVFYEKYLQKTKTEIDLINSRKENISYLERDDFSK